MAELKKIKFSSTHNLDGEISEISFLAKGFKQINDEELIVYFKNEHTYKFIIKSECLTVYVDESYYEFDLKRSGLTRRAAKLLTSPSPLGWLNYIKY